MEKFQHTVLMIAALIGVAACQTGEGSSLPTDSSDGISLRVAAPERIAGSYVDATGNGIEFDTARAGENLYMHVATKSGQVLVHAETTPNEYVFHYLDDRLTLRVDKAWVARVQAEGEDGPAAADDSQMHWTGDMTVLDAMLAVPEVKSLPTLSRSLGALGYTGSAFPASLALHKIARQSADALGIDVEPLDVPDEGSLCTAYPNRGDSCYGMCGRGCSCWSWVCGNCCYHGGCAKHDSWCRQGKWYYCYNITAVIALFGC